MLINVIMNLAEQLKQHRLNIITKLQNDHLEFVLGEEQFNAMYEFLLFLDDKDEQILTLSGNAGTGKTSVMKLIVNYLENNHIDYLLSAPTNKAANILSRFTERDVITLHKLLALKPTLDILLLDFRDLKYTSNSTSSIPRNGVIIIDECSMINDVLYDFIIEKAAEQNSKIIFVGDIKQCAPVKELHLSKSFLHGKQIRLTKIYRQNENNPIVQVLSELRNAPKYSFENSISENGSIVVYNDWRKFVKNTKKLFVEAIEKQDPTLVKLIAYTNKRIESFNSVIRNVLFDNSKEYQIGEILTGYDTTTCKARESQHFGFEVINSEDYVIKDATETVKQIGMSYIKGYNLKLHPINPNYLDGEVFIISRDTPKWQIENLTNEIEVLRLSAVNAKSKRHAAPYWKKYFSLMESFLTPFDLVYENRIIRKKSIDYGYCISVHKSQGSSINNVLIDMGNLLTCKNKEDLRQLQYVAMSRTKNNIVILM